MTYKHGPSSTALVHWWAANAATMHVLGDRSWAAQVQRNHSPMRRAPDNNAEAIIILDGHPKRPDTLASRPRQDVAALVNTALSNPDHSTTSSLRRHLTSSAASSLTHATQLVAAHRCRMLHNAKTTRHPPQPVAPPPRRPPPPCCLYRFR